MGRRGCARRERPQTSKLSSGKKFGAASGNGNFVEGSTMPTYAYEAMNASGQEVKDQIEAGSSEEAIAKIRSRGQYPTKVREQAAKKRVQKKKGAAAESSGPRRKMPISIGGVPRKQLVTFTR